MSQGLAQLVAHPAGGPVVVVGEEEVTVHRPTDGALLHRHLTIPGLVVVQKQVHQVAPMIPGPDSGLVQDLGCSVVICLEAATAETLGIFTFFKMKKLKMPLFSL
jgi:hypothetical protein